MPKIKTPLECIRRLLAEQFPQWANLPLRPVDLAGWDNTTVRLGEDLVVRLPSGVEYSPQVDKEHRWLPVLAPQLPLAIPRPLARGVPGCGFPWPWSTYRWLPGSPASAGGISDLGAFAATLGDFLRSLRAIDAIDGPAPGPHNFWRGGPVATYDEQVRTAIDAIRNHIDAGSALDVWEAALETSWPQQPVWIHGDMNPSNLLVVDGRLNAVIDFGLAGVGDPACDLVMAWTFFNDEQRQRFRAHTGLDGGTWARARGWALWKAAIALEDVVGTDPGSDGASARFGWRLPARDVIAEVIADHRHGDRATSPGITRKALRSYR